MKKLIRFLFILIAGMIMGYLFHDKIDTKLKAKYGNEKVEIAKTNAKKGIENTYNAGKALAKKGVNTVKEAINSVKEDNK
jgi:hypothetical protein